MARQRTDNRDTRERHAAARPGRGRTSQSPKITAHEIEDIEERSSPRTPVIYEVVRRLGEEEMARPMTSLWWSGLAAGLSISFSLLTEAILQSHLPDAPWRPLVVSFGYCVGFIMVVLSRQQLFTESTITVVLPVMADFTPRNLARMGRLWAIVLGANFVGTLVAALFCSFTPVLSPELKGAMLAISRDLLAHGWVEVVFKGITAGFLIAAMVWLMPSADTAQIHVVTLMTYLIAVGGFMHIVAGSMEAFMLAANGEAGWIAITLHFILPALAGNVFGGTALFALLSYAQVMKEI